ncbi:MAG: hypothetical protein ABR600_13400 [Actinomycetota bacterium]
MMTKRLTALLPALVLVAGLAHVSASAASATCAAAPTLREADISQGLPYKSSQTGAPLLAAGKDTVVKLHLTLPDCTSGLSGYSAQITSAKLVFPGNDPSNSDPVNYPGMIVISSSAITDKVPACCAPANNSYGDPKFKVPGPDLLASGNVAFQAVLGYSASPGGTGSLTLNGPATGDSRLTAGFFSTKPWKTLVVPMGAAGQSYCSWFPTTSAACPGYAGTNYSSVLLQAQTAMSRILPVPAGVCSSIPDTATSSASAAGCGVQYALSGTLADLGPSGANVLPKDSSGNPKTPFCGGDMYRIGEVLNQQLQAWNQGNPTHQADNVQGVIPDSKSSSCTTQGMALSSLDATWARLIPDSASSNTGGVSVSGAVAAQEEIHNHGLENNPTYHSSNARADGVYPHRFINTVSTNWDDNNKTVMATDLVGIGANNNNTALEDGDWKCLITTIPAQDRSSCAVGTGPTVSPNQQQTFSITGRLTNSGMSAEVTSVSFSSNQERGLDASSKLQLVFRNTGAGTALKTQGIVLSQTATHPTTTSSSDGAFDAATTVPAGTDRIELRNDGVLVWAVNGNTAPSNVQVFVRPDRFGFTDLGVGTDPSVSPFSPENNVLLTWIGGSCTVGTASGKKIMVQRAAGGTTASACVTGSAPLSPHFGSGDSQIFYVTQFNPVSNTGGDIQTVSFAPNSSTDQSTSPGTFGAVSTVYNCAPQGQLCKPGNVSQTNVGPATDLDVSQDGQITFSADQGPTLGGGDLFLIRNPVAGVAVPLRLTLTNSQSETAPSFSHTAAQSRIVYERCCNAQNQPGLYTLDYSAAVTTPDTGSSSTSLGVNAHNPSWGNGFIAAEKNRVVVTIFPEDADISQSTRVVTGPGTDHAAESFDPSLRASGGPIAFESGPDVWVANSAHVASEVSVVAIDPDGASTTTGNNADFAEVFGETTRNPDGSSPCTQTDTTKCSKDRVPIGVVVPQATREGSQVTFHTVVDLAPVAAGSLAQASVSDYFSTATSFGNTTPPSLSALPKVQSAVISYPAPGSVQPTNQPLWFDGTATDLELGTTDYQSGNTRLTFTWTDDGGHVLSNEPRFFLLSPPLGTHQYTLTVTDQTAQQTVTSTAIVSVTVEQPASSALFQPNTYQVPSNGTLTYYATLSGVSAGKLKVVNAAITKVDGAPVWQYSRSSLPFSATWTSSGDSFTFKISRDSTNSCTSALAPQGTDAPCTSVNNFLLNNGKIDDQIHVFTLEGTFSNGTRFIVEDDDHPFLQPA